MISKNEIEHLKNLARVEFGAKETEKLAKDLGEILEYVEQLREVDVSNVPEMTRALEGVEASLPSRRDVGITAKAVKNVFRKDEPSFAEPARQLAGGLTKEGGEGGGLIDAFPEKHDAGHGTYLKVKSIL